MLRVLVQARSYGTIQTPNISELGIGSQLALAHVITGNADEGSSPLSVCLLVCLSVCLSFSLSHTLDWLNTSARSPEQANSSSSASTKTVLHDPSEPASSNHAQYFSCRAMRQNAVPRCTALQGCTSPNFISMCMNFENTNPQIFAHSAFFVPHGVWE